jgi:hypothetical protein
VGMWAFLLLTVLIGAPFLTFGAGMLIGYEVGSKGCEERIKLVEDHYKARSRE